MKIRLLVITSLFILGFILQGCAAEVTPTSPPVPPATPTPKIVDYVASAEKSLKDGKLEAAYALYSQAIQKKVDLARAFAGRGNILATWRRFDEAVLDYSNALAIVRTPEVLVGRCNAYRLLAKFQQSLADCNEAQKLNPDLIDGYIAFAMLDLDQNKNSDALAVMQEGITKDAKSAKAYLTLSQIQFALGDIPGSIDSVSKSIALEPNEAKYYCERGNLYYATAQLDKTIQDMQSAIKVGIDGKDDECLYKAKGMLQMLGK